MRAYCLLTLAVLASISSASFTGKFLPELQRALKGEHKSEEIQKVESTPIVDNFGLFLNVIANNIGFEIGLVGDYSVGYELPLYQDN